MTCQANRLGHLLSHILKLDKVVVYGFSGEVSEDELGLHLSILLGMS
jgi:hypothetical protein